MSIHFRTFITNIWRSSRHVCSFVTLRILVFCILVDTLTIVLGFKGFLWMAYEQIKPLKYFHRMLKMPGRAQDCLSTINMREVEMRRKKKRIVLVLLRLILCSLRARVSLFSCAYLLTTPNCHNIFTSLESTEFSNLHGTANETWSPQEWNLFPLLFLPAVVTGMAITLIAICSRKKFFGNLKMRGKIKSVSEINTITKASGEIVFPIPPRDDIIILTQFNVIPGIFQNQCSDPNRLSYPAIYELHNNRFSQGLATNHIWDWGNNHLIYHCTSIYGQLITLERSNHIELFYHHNHNITTIVTIL